MTAKLKAGMVQRRNLAANPPARVHPFDGKVETGNKAKEEELDRLWPYGSTITGIKHSGSL